MISSHLQLGKGASSRFLGKAASFGLSLRALFEPFGRVMDFIFDPLTLVDLVFGPWGCVGSLCLTLPM